MSLQQWDLPLTINVSLNGYEWKKLRRKTLAQDVFDRRWSLDGVKTLIKKYKCQMFNFVDLCSGVGIAWSTTTRTRVNDATAVTFFVKCFNPLKFYLLSGHASKNWFASYFLFIHEHLIMIWSPTVNLIAVTTLLPGTNVRFTSLLAKNI